MIAETKEKTVELFEPKIRWLGEDLMNHQCWNFGRDIYHPSGNLLIDYGLERFGVPSRQTGGNSYRMYLKENSELVIWGFGIFLGEAKSGGIFINRFHFSPNILKNSGLDLPIPVSDQLPPNRKPLTKKERKTALDKTKRIVDWIIEYETWIGKHCDKNWRMQCLADWGKATLAPEEIESGWKNLQKHLTLIYPK